MRSLLVVSLTLLIGCEPAPIATAAVKADQCTKDWLMSVETPPCVLDYLNRIGKQQEAISTSHPESGTAAP